MVGLWCHSGEDWRQAASDQTIRVYGSMILSLIIITQQAVLFQIPIADLQTSTYITQGCVSLWTATDETHSDVAGSRGKR